MKKHFTLFSVLFFLFLAGLAIIFLHKYLLAHERKQFPETETNENIMKKIPLDVKQELSKKATTASISATLRVPILMYHYVEYVQDKRDTNRQSLDITPNIFEAQIATLKDAGYTFITAKELGEVLDGTTRLPKQPVLITFDDGHWDLDTDILPILKKYNVKATAYIVPGFIGGSDFLSSQQLHDVITSGLVDVGAHTIHHLSLKGRDLQTVTTEVLGSKQLLEKNYHLHVVSFAYPYGTFDTQAIDVVKNAGFTTSVSTIPGILQNQENRFFLYRLRPGARTGQILLNWLQQSTFSAY